MLKGTNRNFFTIFDYTTYQYDPDGSQSRRKLYTGAGLQLDEQFEYSSWRGLSWKYTRTDPNLLSGSDTWEYRYRYNAMGEREQKRETLNPAGDGTAANGYEWTYYLLGGNRQQLSVWKGLQTSDATFCSLPGGGGSYVHLYPSEYLTYGGSSASVVNKPTATSAVTQEYRIADHLGSNRAILNNSGTVTTTTDYKPFGEVLSGSGESPKSFIDKERDEEHDLGNFGVRSYDYEDGRFTSIDPLWEKYRDWTPYHYCSNSVLLKLDPSGFGDLYNAYGIVGSDGLNDGRKYVLRTDVNSSEYMTADKKIDFVRLKQEGAHMFLELPNVDVRRMITIDVYNKIGMSNKQENGGVIAFSDVDQTDVYIDGGKSEGDFNATKAVTKARNEADEEGLSILYYVHSHPHPNTGASQLPTNKDSDLETARKTNVDGILVTAQYILFYNKDGVYASISAANFIVK